MDKTLTDLQLAFCYEYVATHFNALQAGKNAGYKGTDGVIATTVNRLLKKPNVSKKVSELTERYINQIDLRAADVIKELSILAFWRMWDFVEIDPETRKMRIRSQEEIGERSAAIKEITIKQLDAVTGEEATAESKVISTDIKLKMVDKVKPLETLAQHLGLIKTGREQDSGSGEFAITKKFDLSDMTDKELRTMLKLMAKAEIKNPVLKQ